MKVIEINATYGFASTGVIVKDIEKTLLDNGHECLVAYQFAQTPPEKGYKVGGKLGWKWHAFWTRFYGAQGYASRLATKKLNSWIKSQKPDIVHLHNLHSNYVNLKLLLKFLAKENVNTVLTLHDCWFFTGKCFHFVEDNCYKWQKECFNCPRKNKDAKSLFDRSRKVFNDKKKAFACIKNLTVVGCSDWVKNLASKSLLGGARLERIYNGVETLVFSPDKRTKSNDKFTILGDGNKWLSKTNLPIFQRVVSELTDDEQLTLYGLKKEHFDLIKNHKNVLGVPFEKNQQKMAQLFANADVFVNVTHADTLPTVNMESASSGTPVITFDSCGSPELVVDGVTGYVVKENDIDGILTSIRQVKEGKISRQACREYAIERFDKQKNYLKYLELFSDILG